MQMGTALYNAGKLTQARQQFIGASDDPEYADQADNWVSFVSSEIQRKQAMNGG